MTDQGDGDEFPMEHFTNNSNNADPQEEAEVVVECKLLDYRLVRNTDCVLIVNNNEKSSVSLLNKLLQRFRYNFVDILTHSDKYANDFLYDVKVLASYSKQRKPDHNDYDHNNHESNCQQNQPRATTQKTPMTTSLEEECEFWSDLFLRQNGPYSGALTAPQIQECQSLPNAQERKAYLALIQPMHHLPYEMFADNIQPSIFERVNEFLIIPEAALVLHHLSNSAASNSSHSYSSINYNSNSNNNKTGKNSAASLTTPMTQPLQQQHWHNSKILDRLLSELNETHKLLRLVSFNYEDVPYQKPWFHTAQVVFLFKPASASQWQRLQQIYDKHLRDCFYSWETLKNFFEDGLTVGQAVVILRRLTAASRSVVAAPGGKGGGTAAKPKVLSEQYPVDVEKVRWSTYKLRRKPPLTK
jgi:hypothetical protein